MSKGSSSRSGQVLLRQVFLGLLLALLLVNGLRAQTLTVLSLGAEGTSYVVVDTSVARAYITDGGRAGTSGILGASIGEEDVLEALLREPRVHSVVITCSHSHSDHEGGLRTLIADPRIREFAKLHFIDNDYETLSGKSSLHSIYQEIWGNVTAGPRIEYSSAKERNAFADLDNLEGATVQVRNFEYESGASAHESAVVTEYSLGTDEQQLAVVDFDDAATRVISLWVSQGQPPPRANVIIAAHHGSRHNDLSPVLDRASEIGLRSAVFTVNDNNRYDHPSPEVLRRLILRLGPDNVFVTSRKAGGNVVLSPSGVRYENDSPPRAVLLAFVEHQLDRHSARRRHLIDRAQSNAGIGVLLTAKEVEADNLKRRKLLTPYQARKLAESTEAIADYRAIKSYLLDSADDPPLAILADDPREPPPTDGSARELGPPPPPDKPVPTRRFQPTADTNGVASFRRIAERERRSQSQGGFKAALTARLPHWGGIILGNDVQSDLPTPIAMELRMDSDAETSEAEAVRLLFTLADGLVVDYPAVSPTELWAAWQFTSPTPALSALYGDDDLLQASEEVGLVGIDSSPHGGRWTFGINPAIADTAFARDAMRVDMVVSALQSPHAELAPASVREALNEESLPSFVTYQWYDAPSVVLVGDRGLEVIPQDTAATCLMRIRLVALTAYPDWYNDEHREISFQKEARERLAMTEAVRQSQRREFESVGGRLPTSRQAAVDSILLQMNREAAEKAIARQLNDEILSSYVSEYDAVPGVVEALCRDYSSLQAVDRLARLAALLRWARQGLGELPPLATSVRPVLLTVPARWDADQVFPDHDVVELRWWLVVLVLIGMLAFLLVIFRLSKRKAGDAVAS